MVIQCAWCKDILGEKEPYGVLELTHTICDLCADEMMKREEERKRRERRENKMKWVSE